VNPWCAAVLVVEDEEDIRELIVEFLQSEGFQVYAASNGRDAIAALATFAHPVLVLADMMMPVMDGPSLIAALRADDQLATLPILILSAAISVPEGYRRIKKPFDLNELLRIVEEFCLRRL
jgi:two-component system response regulator CpxR